MRWKSMRYVAGASICLIYDMSGTARGPWARFPYSVYSRLMNDMHEALHHMQGVVNRSPRVPALLAYAVAGPAKSRGWRVGATSSRRPAAGFAEHESGGAIRRPPTSRAP